MRNIGYTAYIRLVPADVLTAGGIGFVATCLAAVMPTTCVAYASGCDIAARGLTQDFR